MFLSMEDQDLPNFFLEWFVGTVGFVLFLMYVWKNRGRNTEGATGGIPSSTNCGSPFCLRCCKQSTSQGLALVAQKLVDRLDEFCEGTNITQDALSTTELHGAISNVKYLIDTATCKNSIPHSIFTESGYEMEDKTKSLPHVWMFPGLARHAFWLSHLHSNLQDILTSSKNDETFKAIESEYRFVNGSQQGWKMNSILSGKWKVFSLYNQGEIYEENSAKCPRTMHFLSTIKSFMSDHVFGNAMFSVLDAGSHIEPHIGPCNYRLRCHLPLIVPLGCTLKVGKDSAKWEKGKLVIFDDSFVHEVWFKSPEDFYVGDKFNFGRVVLIFDIWHPQVTQLEKRALKHIFNE